MVADRAALNQYGSSANFEKNLLASYPLMRSNQLDQNLILINVPAHNKPAKNRSHIHGIT
jgi:hypothetical protein